MNLEKYMLLVNIDMFKLYFDYIYLNYQLKLSLVIQLFIGMVKLLEVLSYYDYSRRIYSCGIMLKEFVLDIVNISLCFFRVGGFIFVVNV